MKAGYHAGEKVVELIENAVDYISSKMGGNDWDKESFRKEWTDKLQKEEKRDNIDEKIEKLVKKVKG